MAKETDASCWRVQFLVVAKCELVLFKKEPLLIVATAVLALAPSFYTGIYVCSVWDSYKNIC